MGIYDTNHVYIFYNLIEQLVVADLAGGVDWANRLEIRHGHLVGPYGLSVCTQGSPV